MLKYRVVEISTVTDEEIESTINSRVKEGWEFDSINFVVREASRGRLWPSSFLSGTSLKDLSVKPS